MLCFFIKIKKSNDKLKWKGLAKLLFCMQFEVCATPFLALSQGTSFFYWNDYLREIQIHTNSKSLLPKYVGWLTIYNNRILKHASCLDFITHFFFRFVTFCSNFISNKHENHNRKWVDCEHYWLMALVVFCLITFRFL